MTQQWRHAPLRQLEKMTNHNPLRIGQIGYGYWGRNLLRNILAQKDIELIGAVDHDVQQRLKLNQQHPQIAAFETIEALLEKTPDAVVIATPPDSHFELAQRLIEKGIHVLIEKPVAQTTLHCNQLIRLAKKNKIIAMVDHTFAYHPAVRALRDRIHSGELGTLQYYDSIRVNFGGFQQANALWDLAPHDLSILDYFLKGQMPLTVSAMGVDHFGVDVENLVYVTLQYQNQFVAHLHLNRIAPVKIRQIMIGGNRKMAVYDDTQSTEKIKIYNQKIALNEEDTQSDFTNAFSREFETKNNEKIRVSYRTGDMIAPAISNDEALFIMIDHFLDCIRTKKQPITNLESGYRVLSILEAAQESMNTGSKTIRLNSYESSPGLPRSPETTEILSSRETMEK